MKYTQEEIIEEHKVYIEFTQYTATDERVEECHGFHTFYDEQITNVIDKITINVNDFEIDITDRLTDLEKQKISEKL